MKAQGAGRRNKGNQTGEEGEQITFCIVEPGLQEATEIAFQDNLFEEGKVKNLYAACYLPLIKIRIMAH